MGASATAYLDDRQFAQALGILERERPTDEEVQRFRQLKTAAWGALALCPTWFVLVLFVPRLAYPILFSAIACLGLTIPLFLWNLRLVRKLWRAATVRRKLRLSERLESSFEARRRRNRVYNAFTAVLTVAGAVIFVLGVIGLTASEDAFGLAMAVLFLFFGATCAFIHFIKRGTERFEVVAELRQSLLASRDAQTGAAGVPVEEYDQYRAIENGQIARDRKRSLARARRTTTETYALRMSRDAREASAVLSTGDMTSVSKRIQELVDKQNPVAPSPTESPGMSVVSVENTSLEISFVVDHEQREVRVVTLGPAQRMAGRGEER
jgi:hypothetical protein